MRELVVCVCIMCASMRAQPVFLVSGMCVIQTTDSFVVTYIKKKFNNKIMRHGSMIPDTIQKLS